MILGHGAWRSSNTLASSSSVMFGGVLKKCRIWTWTHHFHITLHTKKQTNKLHGLRPRVNYTDRATAACRRNDCQLVRIEGATWSAWRFPTAVLSRFSRQEPLLFYQVAPQLYSRGWVDPVPDPLLFFFLVVQGNRTRDSGFAAKDSDH
jgi:hypothetical protein